MIGIPNRNGKPQLESKDSLRSSRWLLRSRLRLPCSPEQTQQQRERKRRGGHHRRWEAPWQRRRFIRSMGSGTTRSLQQMRDRCVQAARRRGSQAHGAGRWCTRQCDPRSLKNNHRPQPWPSAQEKRAPPVRTRHRRDVVPSTRKAASADSVTRAGTTARARRTSAKSHAAGHRCSAVGASYGAVGRASRS